MPGGPAARQMRKAHARHGTDFESPAERTACVRICILSLFLS